MICVISRKITTCGLCKSYRKILIMKTLIFTILISLAGSVEGFSQSVVDFSRNTERIISKIDSRQYTNIHGFLVWKDGQIIGEEYWEGWNRDRPHMLQSGTKSITGLLTGIAIRKGHIQNETQLVLSFFTDYEIRNINDHKRIISLEDLMTMRAGMDWVEYPYNESHLAQMNRERNEWTQFVLDRPMKEEPGLNYAYNSGATILLAGILREAIDMSVQEFSQRYLFEPLDITTAEWWFTDNTNLPHTGGGLRMSAGDMLKIGQLILQCGVWEGNQILDCDFIRKLNRNYLSESLPEIAGYSRGYSLMWHVFPLDPETDMENPAGNFIAAWGAHGQWIFVIPQYNMVVVFIGGTQNFEEEVQTVRIVYEELLKGQ